MPVMHGEKQRMKQTDPLKMKFHGFYMFFALQVNLAKFSRFKRCLESLCS